MSPATPTVITLPSETAGELLGPGWDAAGPVITVAGYPSDCQTFFPVEASRH